MADMTLLEPVVAPPRIPSAVSMREMPALVAEGAVVVDIRSRAQRERQGILPGALAVEAGRVVELLDPASSGALAAVVGLPTVLLLSDDGVEASLFAWELCSRGVTGVRPVTGGFEALAAAGQRGLLCAAPHVRREGAAISAH